MSTPAVRSRPGLRDGIALRRRSPLYRNGYAMVAGSGLTSVLGVVYWALAAQLYSAADVGISAALIAATTLLANLSQLNLKGALNRFLPTAGARSPRLVLGAYAVAVSLALLTASVFVAGTGAWSPELGFLGEDTALAVWFVAATACWTIFVLQDSVLAGIRRAGLVPAGNLVYALAKIVLLVVLAPVAPRLGVFLSWTLPVAVVVAGVNLAVLGRLLPAHVRRTSGRARAVAPSAMGRYVLADVSAYAMWAITTGALPLVVLHVAGAAANGRYYVAWAIAYGLYLIPSGMGQSLLAEAVFDPKGRRRHARRVLTESLGLVAVGVVVVCAAGPLLIGALGSEGGGGGVVTLWLLALSALPYAVTAAHVNLARAENAMRRVVTIYASLCGLVLGLGIPLLSAVGIEGLAVAWLAGQAVVAAGLTLRASRPPGSRVLAPLARRLEPPHSTWVAHEPRAGGGAITITPLGPQGGGPAVIVRRPRTAAGRAALARTRAALVGLAAREDAAAVRPLVPRPVAEGVLAGDPFLAESALPGTPATALLDAEAPPQGLLDGASAAIGTLHDATRRVVAVGPKELERWVEGPIRALAAVAPDRPEALARLRRELVGELSGRSLTTCFVHGDLWAGNVLVDADGRVTGLVDWEASGDGGLARVDLMHLLVTTHARVQRRELGAVVAELLAGRLRPEARRGPGISARAALLLAWLHHIDANLAKSEHYGRHRFWLRANVDPVLAVLAPPAERARRTARARRLAPTAVVAAAVALCGLAVAVADPRGMTDLGLLSVVGPAFPLGLAALVSTAVYGIWRGRGGLTASALAALVVVLHATPAVLYGTLRYSWAWKHVGIVEYVQRLGRVDPGTEMLPVYHNWPGFFGLDALITVLAGAPDAVAQAIWAPLAFNVLIAGALAFTLGSLTADRRVAWAAVTVVIVANWVGQDYFAPQTLALVFYVLLIGVTVRWLGGPGGGRAAAAPAAAALLLVTAIAVTHPLTAVMAVIALAALTVTGACGVRWLPVAAAAIVAGWDLTFAAPYVMGGVADVVESIRLPWVTADANLREAGTLSDGQRLVAFAGRGLVLAVAVLGLAGLVRVIRASRLRPSLPVIALAGAPVMLFAAGDYDGEMLFRIFLFALPFAAVLAAQAFGSLASGRAALAFGATVVMLLGGFTVAHYGKDARFRFTEQEVAAARFVYDRAPRGSLLVEGTRNYPNQFQRYEQFRYVPIDREPDATHRRILRDPVGVLSGWLTDPRDPAAYLIITRSQKAEVAETGALPRGTLETIERRLLSSPRFRVAYRNRDAIVFTAVRERG